MKMKMIGVSGSICQCINDVIAFRLDSPFEEWDCGAICDWLQDLGLGLYVPEARRWLKSGHQLLKATNTDLEKELNIKVIRTMIIFDIVFTIFLSKNMSPFTQFRFFQWQFYALLIVPSQMP